MKPTPPSLFFIALITSLTASGALFTSVAFAEGAPRTAWERFLADPVSKNAKRVERMDYSEPVPYIPQSDLDTLGAAVLKPDPAAVDLGLRGQISTFDIDRIGTGSQGSTLPI